jgi:hypothetical protein
LVKFRVSLGGWAPNFWQIVIITWKVFCHRSVAWNFSNSQWWWY